MWIHFKHFISNRPILKPIHNYYNLALMDTFEFAVNSLDDKLSDSYPFCTRENH